MDLRSKLEEVRSSFEEFFEELSDQMKISPKIVKDLGDGQVSGCTGDIMGVISLALILDRDSEDLNRIMADLGNCIDLLEKLKAKYIEIKEDESDN